jgi:hypothetical protein
VGLQGLALRRIWLIEQQTGLVVLRAVLNNGAGGSWQFVTDDHRHGWYEPGGDRAWGVDNPAGDDWAARAPGVDLVHWSPMCGWLFGGPGQEPRPRDATWGHLCADGTWRVWQQGTRRPQTWPARPGNG